MGRGISYCPDENLNHMSYRMPFFVVYAKDKPGMAGTRTQLRPAHRARLREHDHPVLVRIGGPLLDSNGEMSGSMLIVEAQDVGAVEQFIAGDPYVEAGLYHSVEITEFQWGLTQEAN